MTQAQDLTRYGAIVADAARHGLAGDVPVERGSVSLALPAARLMLDDDGSQFASLAAVMRALADLGRPWVAVGTSFGALGARVDDPVSTARRNRVQQAMQQFAAGQATGPATTVTDSAGEHRAYPIALMDPAGHRRDVYHPLVVHLCLAAFARHYEALPQDAWSVCEQSVPEAVAPMRLVEYFTDAAPPPPLTALVLWQALCLAEQAKLLSRDVDLELIDSAVHFIVSRPGPDDSLHPFGDDESLDTWTYRELVGLHALANLALLRANKDWARRVEQAALYHLHHTQPDNATNQPWGVFAFAWSTKTRSFAEQQLHDATAHGIAATGGGSVNLVAGLLLADAANALRQFDA